MNMIVYDTMQEITRWENTVAKGISKRLRKRTDHWWLSQKPLNKREQIEVDINEHTAS